MSQFAHDVKIIGKIIRWPLSPEIGFRRQAIIKLISESRGTIRSKTYAKNQMLTFVSRMRMFGV